MYDHFQKQKQILTWVFTCSGYSIIRQGTSQARSIQLLGEVPSFGPQVDKELYEYIFCLAMWATGNVCWSFETRRYFGKDSFEVQRTRQVVLHPETKRGTVVDVM